MNRHPRTARGTRTFAACVALCLLSRASLADDHRDAAPPIRLRVEWTTDAPIAASGLFEITRGQLDEPVSLGAEANDPGSVWTDGEAVWIHRRTPRTTDGCDFDVHSPADATLGITLKGGGTIPFDVRHEVRLAEILADDAAVNLNGENGRLIVRRAPGDRIRVAIDRQHLVFDPGETFTAVASVAARDIDPREPAGRLHWRLAVARGGDELASGVIQLERAHSEVARPREPSASPMMGALTAPLSIDLPRQEGVYDVTFEVVGRSGTAARRSVQVVVASREKSKPSEPVAPRGPGREQVVDSFDPAVALERRVAPRAALRLIGESREHSPRWKSIEAARSDAVRFPDTDEPADWLAYRLRVERPGEPHRLAIAFPRQAARRIGVSILEPNAAGRLMPVSLDTGLSIAADSLSAGDGNVGASDGTKEAAFVRHEFVFWPRVGEPIVLVYELDGRTPVLVDRIEVREASLARRPDERLDAPVANQRLVGAYLRSPFLAANFGATESLDETTGRSLHDWVTFQSAAERLAASLHEAGHNSLLLGVLSEGGTVHPSRLLHPTTRHDSGIHFSTGQDPLRKDVLELLFRTFDREGLALVPELQFSTPLPALERAIVTRGGESAGIELIGKDGRSWRESRGAVGGLAPYYNPLDPAVQRAALDVVDELLERYRDHPSFRGLAIESSSGGWMQLPGLDWGYDDRTIARFEEQTGVRVPTAEGNDRFAARHAFLTDKGRPEWVRWRCAQLADFHRRIASRVMSALPHGHYILSASRVLHGENPDERLHDALVSGAKLRDLLAHKGIDFSLYRDIDRLILLRPVVQDGAASPRRNALDRTINDSPDFDREFAGCVTGSLFLHLPHERRLAEFDDVSPWQPAFTRLAAHVLPAGAENRRRFTHALAAYDSRACFDGGRMLPRGQQEPLRDTLVALRRLPPVSFHQLAGSRTQPAVIRFARHGGKTYFHVANDSPWPIEVSLKLSTQAGETFRSLKDDAPLPVTNEGDPRLGTARVQVRSWDIEAFAIDDPAARVDEASVAVPAQALAALEERIRLFDERLAGTNSRGSPVAVTLTNPGFEAPRGESPGLPGWEFPSAREGSHSLDETTRHSGEASLRLTSDAAATAVVTAELPLASGRVAIWGVWLRADRETLPVRLAFLANDAGRPIVRHAEVQAGPEWRRYRLRVEDRPPLASSAVRFGIELRGPGTLWVDDADLELFSRDGNDVRQLTKTLSAVKLAWNERRHADCRRLLDGYWGRVLFFD
ncbi:MAG: hypothetical protein WD066_07910 [Planctomycetaceae bacterium]